MSSYWFKITPVFISLEPRKTDWIKLGIQRPPTPIRPPARSNKGGRPYHCGRAPESDNSVPFSLLLSAFPPFLACLFPWSLAPISADRDFWVRKHGRDGERVRDLQPHRLGFFRRSTPSVACLWQELCDGKSRSFSLRSRKLLRLGKNNE